MNDEWITPPQYINAVRGTFRNHEIDLDPYSNEKAQTIVKAKKYFTKESPFNYMRIDDINIFMNPPYSRELFPKCVNLFLFYMTNMYSNSGVTITNSNHDTNAGSLLLKYAVAGCYPYHRIQFYNQDLKPVGGNRNTSVIYLFSHKTDEIHNFKKAFSEFGNVKIFL